MLQVHGMNAMSIAERNVQVKSNVRRSSEPTASDRLQAARMICAPSIPSL